MMFGVIVWYLVALGTVVFVFDIVSLLRNRNNPGLRNPQGRMLGLRENLIVFAYLSVALFITSLPGVSPLHLLWAVLLIGWVMALLKP